MMCRWITAAALLLVLPGVGFGEEDRRVNYDIDFGLHGGYRTDELDWTIAGNEFGTSPDILSELAWSDLEIVQIGASLRMAAGPPDTLLFAHLQALFDYGWIVEGENRDSDYSGDGRTLEWSRSQNDAGDGEVYDVSFGGGPGFRLISGRLTFVPLLGYSCHRQNLTIQDGQQVLSDPLAAPSGIMPGPLGPIDGLDSAYEAEWQGIWTGLELRWRPFDRLGFSGAFAYHFADYDGKGFWNLRTDLAQPVSFTHHADAYGTDLRIGTEYDLTAGWALGLDARYRNWWTDPGVDRIFFSSGDTAVTRLNEVNWESGALIFEVTRRFF